MLKSVLKGFLVGVSTTDPITLAVAALVLLIVALFASYVPARRAARVDPMVALRFE
jgi:putative ABC transport system permease protein